VRVAKASNAAYGKQVGSLSRAGEVEVDGSWRLLQNSVASREPWELGRLHVVLRHARVQKPLLSLGVTRIRVVFLLLTARLLFFYKFLLMFFDLFFCRQLFHFFFGHFACFDSSRLSSFSGKSFLLRPYAPFVLGFPLLFLAIPLGGSEESEVLFLLGSGIRSFDLSNNGADWDSYDDIFSTSAAFGATLSVLATPCAHEAPLRELMQGRLSVGCLNVDVSASTTVAAVRGSVRHEGLPVKRNTAIAPSTSIEGQRSLICEI
jgi:hypothetical protein